MKEQEVLQQYDFIAQKTLSRDPRLYVFQALTLLSLASALASTKPVFAQEQHQPVNTPQTSSFWGRLWGGRPQKNENSVEILDICHNINHDQFPKGVVQPSGHKCLNVLNGADGIEVSVWEVDGGRRYNVYFDPRMTPTVVVPKATAAPTQAPTEAKPTEQPNPAATSVNLEPAGQNAMQVNTEFASGSTIQEEPYAEIVGPWNLYNSDIFDPKVKHESAEVKNAIGFQIVGKVSVPSTVLPFLNRFLRDDYYQVNVKFLGGESVPGYMPARNIRIEKRPQAIEANSTNAQKDVPTIQPESPTAIITPEQTDQNININVEEIPTIESTQTPPPPPEQTLADAVAPRSQAGLNQNLPLIAKALEQFCILNPNVLAYALATIGHETAGTFQPIEEYNGRQQAITLGYDGGPDFDGKGFLQLTHKFNYRKYGALIGVPDLAEKPWLALDPEISAKILAAYFVERGVAALATDGKFVEARRPINPDNLGGQIAVEAYRLLPMVQAEFANIELMAGENQSCNS